LMWKEAKRRGEDKWLYRFVYCIKTNETTVFNHTCVKNHGFVKTWFIRHENCATNDVR
jgi:hypothetical protein